MINVTSPLMPELESYVEKLKIIWEKRWMTNNGQMSINLQSELEKRTGQHVELFVNGHMALDIAIKALNLHGEIITTPYTFASTTHAIVMNGCTPVFCDINPKDYTIDADKIESLITENTTAILPVHVYGCICDVEKIQKIADKYNLKVIYDAAHAFDVKLGDKSVTKFGDISMLSFHATKVFNTIEGGALVYSEDDTSLTDKVQKLRNFGIQDAENVPEIGLNAKMNEFAAAMGLCNLEIVDKAIERRKYLTESYMQVLSTMPGIKTLDYNDIKKRGIHYNYAYLPIEIDPELAGYDRDYLMNYLAGKGIGTRKYFYPLITDFACYKGRFDSNAVPIAKKVSSRILTLPMSASISDDELKIILDRLLEIKA